MQIANRTHGRRRHTERITISITVSGKHHQQNIELQCSVTDSLPPPPCPPSILSLTGWMVGRVEVNWGIKYGNGIVITNHAKLVACSSEFLCIIFSTLEQRPVPVLLPFLVNKDFHSTSNNSKMVQDRAIFKMADQ